MPPGESEQKHIYAREHQFYCYINIIITVFGDFSKFMTFSLFWQALDECQFNNATYNY